MITNKKHVILSGDPGVDEMLWYLDWYEQI